MPSLQRAFGPLAYTVSGAGEPVLFIQGVGVNGSGWNPQVEDLARSYRCITFDNRGIGASTPCREPVTMQAMVEDCLALLDAEGVESAHVVGHSMGGFLAQMLALQARKRVRSLALLCTFPRGSDASALTARMLWLGLRSNLGTKAMRRRAFLEILLPPPALPAEEADRLAAELAPLFGHDLATQPPIAMTQLFAMRGLDLTGQLRQLEGLRTLVLSGAHDPIARPSVVLALAEAIPGAKHVAFEDAAHGLPIQHPERVNGLLRSHFEG